MAQKLSPTEAFGRLSKKLSGGTDILKQDLTRATRLTEKYDRDYMEFQKSLKDYLEIQKGITSTAFNNAIELYKSQTIQTAINKGYKHILETMETKFKIIKAVAEGHSEFTLDQVKDAWKCITDFEKNITSIKTINSPPSEQSLPNESDINTNSFHGTNPESYDFAGSPGNTAELEL